MSLCVCACVLPSHNAQEKSKCVTQPQETPSRQGKKVGVGYGDGSIEKLTNVASSLASQIAAVNTALERYYVYKVDLHNL